MKNIIKQSLLLSIIVLSLTSISHTQPADLQKWLDEVGIKSTDDTRGQLDTVGYASTAEEMDKVIAQGEKFAAEHREFLQNQFGITEETTFTAGVCPHDDYYYASRLYSLLIPHIKAKTVIIFGVCHRARSFNVRDVIIFDSYKAWHGPYGNVKVSPIREEIIEKLPQSDYIINDDMQMLEHSVEAIVPFLQAYNREVEIVSIVVPYMEWERLDRLAGDFAAVLSDIMRKRDWKLGEDVSIICSTDAVHYGDQGWGGSDYADFGSDAPGYMKAVVRDLNLAEETLCGEVERSKLKDFMTACIDPDDITRYLISWCGRFSVPFGLNVASRTCEKSEGRTLTGTLLDYGTSLSEISFEIEGLGTTAPNNFHHWVGYVAIGYR